MLGKTIVGEEANGIYQTVLQNQSWLIKNAKETCEILSREGYIISIVTNGIGKTQRSRIIHSTIHPYISNLFISEEIGTEKPQIGFFNKVLSVIKSISKSEVLIVGDSLSSDIQGGINCGIDTCWFNKSGSSLPNNIRPNYVINELIELLQILS